VATAGGGGEFHGLVTNSDITGLLTHGGERGGLEHPVIGPVRQ